MSAEPRQLDEDENCPLPNLKHKKKQEDVLQLKKVFNELAEELKCALCLELFEKPVILVCLHTFCATCLRELVLDNCVVCPLCRSRQELDAKGVEGLNVNYHLLNIAEKMRSASTKRCDECQMVPVAEYCQQCRAYLCLSCGMKIHALRLMRVHTRRSLDPSDSLTMGGSMSDLDVELDELRICSSSSASSSPSPSPSPSPTPSSSSSPSMILRTDNATIVQPDDIIVDFVIRRDKCLEFFRNWIKNLWFAPSDFRATYHVKQVKPLLVPYWLFEVEMNSSYTASYCLGVGGTKDTHWSSIAGESPGRFRLAVCACNSLDSTLVSKIGPWDLEEIRPPATSSSVSDTASSSDDGEIRSVALGGIPRSQVLGMTLDSPSAYQQGGEGENVEAKAMRMAADHVEKVVRDRVGGMSSVRNVRLRSAVTRVAAQRVFMPVWMVKYVYNGQSYVVVVNGQQGQIYGDRPYSMGKVASLSLTGLGAIVGIFAKAK